MRGWILVLAIAAACGGGHGGGDDDDDVPPADAPVDVAEPDAAPDAMVDAPLPDAMVDAPLPDASDAGMLVCDPLAVVGQQGCLTGQKCTWITTQTTPEYRGRVGCVPDGAAAIGDACVVGPPGPSTGYDDCAAGGYCINARCHDLCAFDGSVNAACAQGFHCTRYANTFSNGGDPPTHGVCNRECDPITQLQTDGQPCGANMGCYILTNTDETFTICAGAGSIQVRGLIAGTSYANSCVPGAQPRRRTSSSTEEECGGLCRPADVTSTTNMVSEGGVGATSCQQRWGMPAPDQADGESCRYWWARERSMTISPWGSTVGWCFRHGAHQFDSNGDNTPDMPFPRCVNLTTGDVEPPFGMPAHNDALYFWCVAPPQMLTGAVHDIRRWRARHEPRLDTLAPP
jgi:hypothetical protein